jgi:hypothetical protein
MHPQYARPKCPEYQDLFHAICSIDIHESQNVTTKVKSETITEILDTMNHLNLSDARSQYMLNKSLAASNMKGMTHSNNRRRIDSQLQYTYVYIDFIRQRKGPEIYNRFSKSTQDNRFWKDSAVRPFLYDWLICIAIAMKLTAKVYFRAVMICDLFLLENYAHVAKLHSDNSNLLEFFLRAKAFISIYLACKADGSKLIGCQMFRYFIPEWPEGITMSQVLELEVEIINCVGSLTFDTYIDIIADELIKNHFCTENFRLLRQICEYVLMRTVVVDNDCLRHEIQPFCVAVLINAIEIVHKAYQRLMEFYNRKYNKEYLFIQMSLHVDSIVKNSGFSSSLVNAVAKDVRERLERFEEDEFYSSLGNIGNVLNLHSIFSSEEISSII